MRSIYCVGRPAVVASLRGVGYCYSFLLVVPVSDRMCGACTRGQDLPATSPAASKCWSCRRWHGSARLGPADRTTSRPISIGSQYRHATSDLTEVLEEVDTLLAAIGWDQSFKAKEGCSISVVCIAPGLTAAVRRGSVWANNRLVFNSQTQAAFRRESGPEVGGFRSITRCDV